MQHLYESILNSAGEGICGLDFEGRITFVNPAAAKITGWKIEELVGQCLYEIFRHAKHDEVLKDMEQMNSSEQSLYRKDGTQFHAEYVQTPIHQRRKLR